MRDPVAERVHRRTMRRLIAAFASLAVTGGLAAGIGAAPALAATPASHTARSTAPALVSIRRFIASLSPEQRTTLSGPTGTGLRLGDLTGDQRALARELMRSLLTADARAVLVEAMAADDALAAAGLGDGSDDYRLGIVETAESTFLQFAGPQLAVNALVHASGVIVEPELIQS